MEKKYEFTGETMEFYGHTLRRIRALHDFGDVKKGDIGGWIEKEDNLSHEGDCWVYDDGKIFENASIYENAQVSECARVLGYAKVFGNCWIHGDAIVGGRASVHDNAEVCAYSIINRDVCVYGNAYIKNASISDISTICGNVKIECGRDLDSKIYIIDSTIVTGNTRLINGTDEPFVVAGGAYINITSNTPITSPDQILTINNIMDHSLTFINIDGGIIASEPIKNGVISIDDFEQSIDSFDDNSKRVRRAACTMARTVFCNPKI